MQSFINKKRYREDNIDSKLMKPKIFHISKVYKHSAIISQPKHTQPQNVSEYRNFSMNDNKQQVLMMLNKKKTLWESYIKELDATEPYNKAKIKHRGNKTRNNF